MTRKLISMLIALTIVFSLIAYLPGINFKASAATSTNWVWPTSYHSIQSDWPNYSNGTYHGGTDFPVSLNTPVYSSCDGEVVNVTTLINSSGNYYSYGKYIRIKATVNGSTVYIRYCHLNGFNVSVGDKVKAGQQIAVSGSTGNSSGPHLHYEVRNANDTYNPSLNPRNYLPGSSLAFATNSSEKKGNMTTPTISLDKKTYTQNENIHISWAKTSADTDFKEYWLVITNASTGAEVYGGNAGSKDNVNKNYYDLKISGAAKYNITVYAVPYNDKESRQKSASTSITVGAVGNMAVPKVTTSRTVYSQNETVHISWTKTSADTDFYQYWLIVKNNTTGKEVYGGDAGSTYNVNKNTYDIKLATAGSYTISVYSVPYINKDTRQKSATVNVDVVAAKNLGNDFYAYIVNKDTDLYLTNNGSAVVGKALNGNKEQKWHFVRNSNGTYKIISTSNNYALDVRGTSDVDGTDVIPFETDTGNSNQQFYIFEMYGAYYIRPAFTTTKMLDMAQSGTHSLSIWGTGADWSPQKFNIIIYGVGTDQPVDLGNLFTAEIKNIKTGRVVVNGPGDESVGNTMVEASSSSNATTRKWTFIRNSNGSYTIASNADSRVIDVVKGIDKDLTNVCIYKSHDVACQRWFIYKLGDNKYYFRPETSSTKVMDVSVDTGNCLLYTYHGGDNQLFQINVSCVHNVKAVAATPATCTTNGTKAHWYCSKCKKYFSDANCTKEITQASTVIKATGHKTTATAAQAATCTANGHTAYWYCSTCKKYFSDKACTKEITLANTVVKATGHKATAIAATPATCTANGSIACWKCSSCGKYYSDKACTKEITQASTVVKATGHKATAVTAQSATCTTNGHKAYWYCSTCKKYFSDKACTKEMTQASTVVKATGHKYTTTVVAPTCTEKGYTLHKCSVCGDSYKDTETAAKGHKYGNWTTTKAATCAAEGQESRKCTACGNTETRAIAKTTTHTWGNWTTKVQPTVNSEGTSVRECSVCHKQETKSLPKIVDENASVISIDKITGSAGQTVTAKISIENNPGITAFGFTVNYDGSVMTLTNAESKDFGALVTTQIDKNNYYISWANNVENITTNGTIAELTFKISDGAASGSYALTLKADADEIYKIVDKYGETQNVAFALNNGEIKVSEYLPGDINMDGKVNMKDVTRLHQYVAKWPVTVNQAACDTNGDGKVNMKDVTRLHQYVAKWPVEIY